MVKNRRCLSCQTSYNYCPNCSGPDRFAPSWKAEFCSESCKDLWLTATKFNMKLLSKSEAKSIISNLDLKPIDEYVECVRRDFKNIMAEEPKKRGKRAELKILDEVADIKPEVLQPVITTEAIEPVHEVIIEKEDE